MPLITHDYMLNHDMDIFFRIKNIPIHIATNGCIIPNEIADNDIQKNILNSIRLLDSIPNNIVTLGNENFINNIIQESYSNLEDYTLEELRDNSINIENIRLNIFCQSFYHFSERGLYSFDYSQEYNSFYLVTKPSRILDNMDLIEKIPVNKYIENLELEKLDNFFINFFGSNLEW